MKRWMKKFAAVVATAAMVCSVGMPAFAAENDNYYTNKLGVAFTQEEYNELTTDQCVPSELIERLTENEKKERLDNSEGFVVGEVDQYLYFDEEGNTKEISQTEAIELSEVINNVLPYGSDSRNDGVVKVMLVVYKITSGSRAGMYSVDATANWLTIPPMNAKDILAITHTNGFNSNINDYSASYKYDYTYGGSYTTKSETIDKNDIIGFTGHGGGVSYPRVVIDSAYNDKCKNQIYNLRGYATPSSSKDNQTVQATFMRASKSISWGASIGLSASGLSVTPSVSYASNFTGVLTPQVSLKF